MKCLSSSVVLFVLVSAAIPAVASAQSQIGVKGGITRANLITSETGLALKAQNGPAGGAFFVTDTAKPVSLQAEALLLFKGSTFSETGLAEKMQIKLRYIEVPLLARFNAVRTGQARLFFFGGPSIGIKQAVDVLIDGKSIADGTDDELNRLDLGVSVGGGLDAGRFVFDARYIWGLTKIDDDEDAPKNRALVVMAGFRFK